MSKYKFTLVALANCDDGFDKTIESILKATGNLRYSQLIIADTVCSDMTNAAKDKAVFVGGDKVVSVDCKGFSTAKALNLAIKEAQGEYLFIAEEGVIYKKKNLDALLRYAKKHPEATPVMAAGTIDKDENLKKYARFPIERNGVVDLFELPYFGQTAISTFIFKTELIRNIPFDENIHEECKKKFVLEALLKTGKIIVIEKQYVFYSHALENDNNLFRDQHHKWYYTDSLNNFIIPFMKRLKSELGEVPKFVQYALSQLICAKYGNNYYENDKGVLSKEEALEFYELTLDALMLIDNAIFTEAAIRCKYILRSLWMQLLKGKLLKASIPYKLSLEEELITLEAEGNEPARISTLQSVNLTINNLNYSDGVFEFDGEFTGKDFMEAEDVELFAEYGGKKHRITSDPIYPLMKCFGLPYTKKYNVHFFVPEKELDTLSFTYKLCGEFVPLPIHFAMQFSRLRLRFPNAYWKYSKTHALAIKNDALYTFKCTGIRHVLRELGLYISMLIHGGNPISSLKYIVFRTIYHLSKPFFKNKRVFFTFDKLYKAGDNGEYFWRYANKIDGSVETYYVISKDSLDCPRLKAYDKKHVLIHNSFKCRLYALHAEAIVATHTMVMQYCGFPKYMHPYVLDLWNNKVICIQHGLTVQQLAQYQRRNYDNTTLYCLASKYEKENLMHPIYGYEESMLKINGLARYDGLKNNDKKLILITPTWRRNVVSQGIAYKKKPYNELFKTTEYFRLYNKLITDEKLINCAKKNGYNITYLLHPAMSPQLEDFDSSGYVKIIAASGDMNYEEILTTSSLMVTDYSGVQFDFAYMRKPIVYYHPDTLPPHYEAGGIDYPSQGFGPICTNHETLVDTICKFMENQCRAEDEYKRRADDFFAFDDHNNCERIYREILKFLEK